MVMGTSLLSQEPTHVYLFQLTKTSIGKYHVSKPVWLSGFNADGYTNQPWFASGGQLLVSVKYKHDNQVDIWQLSPGSRRIRQITSTSANEFSPRLTPDGKSFSVLCQQHGDMMDQQIVRFSKTGGAYEYVLPEWTDVGYYCWVRDDGLAAYRLDGETNHLYYYDFQKKQSRKITSAVGRALYADKEGAVLYVHKFDETFWYLKRYLPATGSIEILAQMPDLVEDFTLGPDGVLYCGKDSQLYYFKPGIHKQWQEMEDLAVYDIHGITRLAVSPDNAYMVVVGNQGPL